MKGLEGKHAVGHARYEILKTRKCSREKEENRFKDNVGFRCKNLCFKWTQQDRFDLFGCLLNKCLTASGFLTVTAVRTFILDC